MRTSRFWIFPDSGSSTSTSPARRVVTRPFMAGNSRGRLLVQSLAVKSSMRIASSLTLACWIVCASTALAQDPQAVVDRVSNQTAVRNAQQFIDTDHDRIVREIIAINEIPAPPFKEADRARAFAQMLRESGLANVEIDPEGNVLGLRKGTGSGPLVAVAAHLDTVFPEGTDVRVRREGNR